MSYVAFTCVRLKPIVCLKHSIQMTDQQNVWAFAVKLSTEHVPCPSHILRHFDPVSLKAKGVELAPHDHANIMNALHVHRAAADVYGFL
jgi:hypothetical protein